MSRAARTLIVDDEAAILKALTPLLRSRGYGVDTASTGAEALRAVAERTPDLMILDLGLPDLDGAEVCARVRAQSTLPIVVLSARGALIPLALGGIPYRPLGAAAILRRNLLIYGVGGVIVPFVGIKLIDMVLVSIGLA